jgi:hypothetical protein
MNKSMLVLAGATTLFVFAATTAESTEPVRRCNDKQCDGGECVPWYSQHSNCVSNGGGWFGPYYIPPFCVWDGCNAY